MVDFVVIFIIYGMKIFLQFVILFKANNSGVSQGFVLSNFFLSIFINNLQCYHYLM